MKSNKAIEILVGILETPGLVEYKIECGLLVMEFENGIVVNMTVPEVVERSLHSNGEEH
jgi:hypothetical protein